METSIQYRVEGQTKEVGVDTAADIELEEIPEAIGAQKLTPDVKFTIPKKQVIQHRTLTKNTAKKEVLELFEQKGELDYGDIIETLGLDLEIIVDVCRELQEEGRIQEID